MYEIYSKTERRMFLALGLLIAFSIVYVTHLYFEYRVINNKWAETFTTPKEYWNVVPDWKWKSVITDQGVRHG